MIYSLWRCFKTKTARTTFLLFRVLSSFCYVDHFSQLKEVVFCTSLGKKKFIGDREVYELDEIRLLLDKDNN